MENFCILPMKKVVQFGKSTMGFLRRLIGPDFFLA